MEHIFYRIEKLLIKYTIIGVVKTIFKYGIYLYLKGNIFLWNNSFLFLCSLSPFWMIGTMGYCVSSGIQKKGKGVDWFGLFFNEKLFQCQARNRCNNKWMLSWKLKKICWVSVRFNKTLINHRDKRYFGEEPQRLYGQAPLFPLQLLFDKWNRLLWWGCQGGYWSKSASKQA